MGNSSFTVQLTKILNETEGKWVEGAEQAINEVSKRGAKNLRASSPKRTGAYAKSWTTKAGDGNGKGGYYSRVIYNRDHYRRVHLLENGHKLVAWGRPTSKTVDGIVHVARADAVAQAELAEAIKKAVRSK